MTTVTEDLVQGHTLTDIIGGSQIRRTYRVAGLVAAAPGQLIEAIRDPLIPKIRDQYPGAEPLYVISVDANPDGPNAARVEVLYAVQNRATGGSFNQPFPSGNDGQDVKQISAGFRQRLTSFDRDLAPMTLPVPTSAQGNDSFSYLSQANFNIPVGEIVFERVETTAAVFRARDLVGKLNDSILGGGLYQVDQMLFSNLDAVSEDGGFSWNCTYTFSFDADRWIHHDWWKGDDGKVPPDAARESFDVIAQADFSTLGLDFTASQTPIS
jgi:hypothetical protein